AQELSQEILHNRGEKRRSLSSSTRDRPIGSPDFEPVPNGSRPSRQPLSRANLLKGKLVTESNLDWFENLQISFLDPNPRSFPYSVKQQCWDKAEKIKDRNPDRWAVRRSRQHRVPEAWGLPRLPLP
ncbi:hypothetical protein U1Q18_024930, partial [Sarracenia purpurea var. burkii]